MPARLSPAQQEEARTLYQSDPRLSVDTLAASYGVGRTVMLRVLDGVTRPPGRRNKSSTRTETMIRMRDEGLTYEQIGRQVGLTPSGVFRRIERHERGRR